MSNMAKEVAVIKDGRANLTEYGKKCHRILELNSRGIGIHISEEILSIFSLQLIPVRIDGKYGFIDKEANLVIEALFDEYLDVFENENSLIRVCIEEKWGVINAKGDFVINPEYSGIFISNDNTLFTVSKNYRPGVINLLGEVIVDFGKYDYIDGFDTGLARVKIKGKWGIIDSAGKEVLPIEYDNIWNFYKKNRSSTRVEKDNHTKYIQFADLLNSHEIKEYHTTHYYPSDDYSSVHDYPEYNDCLDMDQQSIDFWNNF